MTGIELYGYFGSVLVAVSLMMSNVKKLRWYNFFGAAAFASYGLIIDAWPVFILNGWIALVDVYYLVQMYRTRDQFDLVESHQQDAVLNLFLANYGEDISKHFPEFDAKSLATSNIWLTFRNMKPAGLFVVRQDSENAHCGEIVVDYVTPDSRDMKGAEFLYEQQLPVLKGLGYRTLVAKSEQPTHKDYLTRLGFVNGQHNYQLVL